jgi:hypothetical protein
VRADILNLQQAGARVTMMGDFNDPVYAYFNPCIAYDGDGKIRINIRACTFAVLPRGPYYFRDGVPYSKTKNLYGYLDPETLAVTGLQEVQYSPDTPQEIWRIGGLEDARLFWREDGMHFIGVQVDTRPAYRTPPQQAEFVYDELTNTLQYYRTMFGESPIRGEKNWMPPDVPGTFDFSYSPTEVIANNGKVFGSRYAGFIHGSSQLLWQPESETYLAVLHSKHRDPLIVGRAYDNMIYVHYFAEYNAAGLLKKISQPFTFGLEDYIQFVAGAVEVDGDLLMSLGAGDARMGFARIRKEKVLSMLKPYDGTEHSPLPPLTRAQQRYLDYASINIQQSVRPVPPPIIR